MEFLLRRGVLRGWILSGEFRGAKFPWEQVPQGLGEQNSPQGKQAGTRIAGEAEFPQERTAISKSGRMSLFPEGQQLCEGEV